MAPPGARARAGAWLQRAARRLAGRPRPRLLVLFYHRVCLLERDPQLLTVSPDHFAEHLTVLRDAGPVVDLRAGVAALAAGTLPDRAVAVTFDDGYADNCDVAAPLLERHAVPATVFVTTAGIDAGRELYWDEVERVLLCPGLLPRRLALGAGAARRTWYLGDAADYPPEEERRHRGWNATRRFAPTARHAAYRGLLAHLGGLGVAARAELLRELRECADLGPEGRPSHATLGTAALRQLAAGGHVAIGAHTVNHPRLARLPRPEQETEMTASKLRLEALLGAPVTCFAYPFGHRGDYGPETVAAARRAGFTVACTTEPGTVTAATSPLELPRALVRDCSGRTFARRLERWWHA
ncbi:MAG TPA: polysaccharide deacetylase family protein [Polyangia bacterium]|jgi:peptidoglycan/xylan/chitin deacetylase (PgdA/CDA1 family)